MRNWFSRSDADHRDKLLACGALIVAELRIQVLKETEFTCSAGIAHNKVAEIFSTLSFFSILSSLLFPHPSIICEQMLAKLASGMNKPAQLTVVPLSSVRELLDSLPIKKM